MRPLLLFAGAVVGGAAAGIALIYLTLSFGGDRLVSL